MKIKFYSLIPLLTLLSALPACNVKEVLAAQEEELSAEETCFVEGEMIVQLEEEPESAADVVAMFADLGVVSAERLYPYDEEWEERHRAYGLHLWYVLKYSEQIVHTKAAGDLSDKDGVGIVEMPRKIHSMEVNDPYFSTQWHYYNDGSLGSGYSAGCDVNCVPVWENFTGGSNDVIVGVVDGGIDLTHEDLAAVTIAGGTNGSKNFVDNSYQIVAHDHGTHVAGTIGAINNNGKGVCGIAGGTDGTGGVKLLSCQVFKTVNGKDQSGNTYSAIVWAADHGAVICQNSWGYTYSSAEDAKNGNSNSIGKAIQYFIDNAGKDSNGNQKSDSPMAGGVVIFAAGNDAWPDGWPAEDERVIAVGAIGANYRRSYYSNYGDWVDICAPGGDANAGSQIVSTLPSNKYGKMQGTSMACPHVSGVAALIVSYFGGQGFTNEMLKERLLGGANTEVISSSSQIGGLVDAYGSFNYGDSNAPNPVNNYTVTPISNSLSFTVAVPADAQTKRAEGLLLLASRNEADFNDVDPKNLPSGMSSAILSCDGCNAGDMVTGRITGLEFSTEYYAAVIAYDYSFNYSEISSVKKATTLDNNPPQIICEQELPLILKAHETATFKVKVNEPDGHTYTTSFIPGSAAAEFAKTADADVYQVTITGYAEESGVYQAVFGATDCYGKSASFAIDYQILENHPPQIVKQIDDQVFDDIAAKMSFNMDEYIQDPDGEKLTYSISISDKSVLHINPKDNILNLTTLDYGKATVTITASDARKEQCILSFRVLVSEPDSPASIYPNPLVRNEDGKSMLYVAGTVKAATAVTVTSSNGKVVYKGEEQSSAFEPMEIDMDACSAGVYTVKVVIEGVETVKNIVKL